MKISISLIVFIALIGCSPSEGGGPTANSAATQATKTQIDPNAPQSGNKPPDNMPLTTAQIMAKMHRNGPKQIP